MSYAVTIASGALDEHPGVTVFDEFYEAQDHIFEMAAEELGLDYSEEDFEQFMQYVKLEEL